MNSRMITVIVPRLPPAVDGLGDYGLALAMQLRQDFGIISEFIVCDPGWSGPVEIEGFSIHKLLKRSGPTLAELLYHREKVLLHYVGYGYAKRGTPFWLLNALKEWKGQRQDRKLTTMFHELYAFGPVWTSQFWTSPTQRLIAKILVRLSDRCITSKEGYARIISRLSNGRHEKIDSFPVFSNIGEPQIVLPLASREPRLIIFGSRGPKERVYHNAIPALKRVCTDLGITEIIDIGLKVNFPLPTINGLTVKSVGVLSPGEISEIMSRSMVGFFSYPTEYLSKSGIFAAYCAHGMLPVGVWYHGQSVDQVEQGIHYWLADKFNGAMTLEEGQEIAVNANTWYVGHSLPVLARHFAGILSK